MKSKNYRIYIQSEGFEMDNFDLEYEVMMALDEVAMAENWIGNKITVIELINEFKCENDKDTYCKIIEHLSNKYDVSFC